MILNKYRRAVGKSNVSSKNFFPLYVVITTSKVMARQWMRQGKLGNALTWALRSHDVPLTTYLGDQFLDRYLREGNFVSTDLLENLGSCMLVSDRLTFLGKDFASSQADQSP